MKTNVKKTEKMVQKEGDLKKRMLLKKPNGFQKSEWLNQKPKKADDEDEEDDDKEDDKEEDDDTNLPSKNDVAEVQNIILNTLGNTNLTVIQEAIDYLDDLPLEVIKEALLRTARKQKKWDYAKGILNNWISDGLDTLRKIEAKDVEFKSKNIPKEETEEEKFNRKLKELEES